MKTAAELRAEAAEVKASALALLDRDDITEEQQKSVQDSIKKAEALLARAESIDALQKVEPVIHPDEEEPEVIQAKVEKPKFDVSIIKRHAPTKAFGNDNAGRESAYRCGKWLQAAVGKNRAAEQWCRDHGVIRGALSTGDNELGGVLVPDEFNQVVVDLREMYGVARREARVLPMSSDHMNIPRRSSGFTTYYVGDNDAITASDKNWNNVELTAKKIGILCRYSSELSEDAIVNIADDLANEMAWAFSKAEDDALFIGDGTSTYGGQYGFEVKIDDGNHTASIKTAATGNTSFETLDLADFHGVVAKCPGYARANAKWYIHRVGFSEAMERLAYAGGGNTVQTIGGGVGPSFLGYPVVLVESMNSTSGADTSDIKVLFGDMRQAATLGSRRDIAVATSSDRYFDQDQLAIRATSRFAVNVHDIGDTTNAGPIVALKTPAS